MFLQGDKTDGPELSFKGSTSFIHFVVDSISLRKDPNTLIWFTVKLLGYLSYKNQNVIPFFTSFWVSRHHSIRPDEMIKTKMIFFNKMLRYFRCAYVYTYLPKNQFILCIWFILTHIKWLKHMKTENYYLSFSIFMIKITVLTLSPHKKRKRKVPLE